MENLFRTRDINMKANRLYLLAFLVLAFGSVKGQQKVAAGRAFAAGTTATVWKKSSLKSWLTHYQYEGFYQPFNSGQIVNVLDIDHVAER
ncbi:MAG: hypothetical protein ACO1NS_00260 [Daejeonella sp.]